MFKVYFSEIVSPEFEKEIDFNKEDVEVEELLGNGNVKFLILKSSNLYEVKGVIAFKLNLQCSRCLEFYEKEYKEEFEVIVRRGEEKLDKDVKLTEEDINTIFVNYDYMDLTQVIRDYIILSIPMKPLCSSECKGLCQVCGTNLNKKDCKHNKEMEIDERWKKLYEILGGEDGSSKKKGVKNKGKEKKNILQTKKTNIG